MKKINWKGLLYFLNKLSQKVIDRKGLKFDRVKFYILFYFLVIILDKYITRWYLS